MSNNQEYKVSHINNRRYLGNKYKLLNFIRDTIYSECGDFDSFADVFSGTGSVSSGFQNKIIITNDIMYSSYICNLAWFGSQKYNRDKIIDFVCRFNSINISEANYMTDNFADTYFSYDDCSKIGIIREEIESCFTQGQLNERERAILISSLIYAMDHIAQTCGHYDAYRKGASFDSHLELSVPDVSNDNNPKNQCYNMDSNILAKTLNVDVAYIDPPYNSRQYCDAYHLLENVARWEKPIVTGAAKKMDRKGMKSRYCTRSATEAFEELVRDIHAKFIILSYNNMATKGNDRSNARITDEDIMRILERKGTVKIFSENYRAFTTGKSDISGNQERLFVCTVNEDKI